MFGMQHQLSAFQMVRPVFLTFVKMVHLTPLMARFWSGTASHVFFVHTLQSIDHPVPAMQKASVTHTQFRSATHTAGRTAFCRPVRACVHTPASSPLRGTLYLAVNGVPPGFIRLC